MVALLLAASASAASTPVIESESVAHLSSTDATLEAQVNPNGQSDWAQFQLVEEPSSYASEILCPESGSPGFSGCIGNRSPTALPLEFVPGNAEHPESLDIVSLDLGSARVTLKPDTTYHYRLLAAPAVQTEDTIQWEEPTIFGEDQTFTTPPPGAPSINSESVSQITGTDASLEATIEPHGGRNAFYQFQLVKNPSEYASDLLCPPPPWPGYSACAGTPSATALPIGWVCGECEIEPAAMAVHLDLASAGIELEPGTTFHYRVLAAAAVRTEDTIQWEEPILDGEDRTFTTNPTEPPPIEGGPIPAPPQGEGGPIPAPPLRRCWMHGHQRHHRHHRHAHHHRRGCRTGRSVSP